MNEWIKRAIVINFNKADASDFHDSTTHWFPLAFCCFSTEAFCFLSYEKITEEHVGLPKCLRNIKLTCHSRTSRFKDVFGLNLGTTCMGYMYLGLGWALHGSTCMLGGTEVGSLGINKLGWHCGSTCIQEFLGGHKTFYFCWAARNNMSHYLYAT